MERVPTYRCEVCGIRFEVLDPAHVTHGRCLDCQVAWRCGLTPEDPRSHEMAEFHRQRMRRIRPRVYGVRC